MIEVESFADSLSLTERAVRTQGPVTWERVSAWQKAVMPRLVEPLSDEQDQQARDGRSDEDIDERLQDDAASRYKAEVEKLVRRMSEDAARLRQIIAICCPAMPTKPRNQDLLAAQIAAEGFCVSCYRNDQMLKWRETRNDRHTGYKERYRHRELCLWCLGYKNENGILPPVPLLRVFHRKGRQMTTADVDRALGKVTA